MSKSSVDAVLPSWLALGGPAAASAAQIGTIATVGTGHHVDGTRITGRACVWVPAVFSTVEVDDSNLDTEPATVEMDDSNFDYEAVDALDFDEELEAGEFNFESEAVEIDETDAESELTTCPTGRVKTAFNRGCASVLSDNHRGCCQLRYDDGRNEDACNAFGT